MRGYTLIELLAVLTLFAVGASMVSSTARRLGDRAAVTTAREKVVAALGDARVQAMATGRGTVVILADPPEVRTRANGRPDRRVDLDDTGHLRLDLGGGRDSTEIRFDALGLGRMASQTIVLTRGDASATVVVSSFGRIRRR